MGKNQQSCSCKCLSQCDVLCRLTVDQMLHFLITVLPIVLSLILMLRKVLFNSSKHAVLSNAAESVKKGIYEYRARAGAYATAAVADTKLQKCLELKRNMLFMTEASKSRFSCDCGKLSGWLQTSELRERKLAIMHADDNGVDMLDVSHYEAVRLKERKLFFQEEAERLNKRLQLAHIALYFLGGLGTCLVIFEAEIWVGLSLAVVNALTIIINDTKLVSSC